MSWFSWLSGRPTEPPAMSKEDMNSRFQGPQQQPRCEQGQRWGHHPRQEQDHSAGRPGHYMGSFGPHAFPGCPPHHAHFNHHSRGCGQERRHGWSSRFGRPRYHHHDYHESYGFYGYPDQYLRHHGHHTWRPWHHGHHGYGYRECH